MGKWVAKLGDGWLSWEMGWLNVMDGWPIEKMGGSLLVRNLDIAHHKMEDWKE